MVLPFAFCRCQKAECAAKNVELQHTFHTLLQIDIVAAHGVSLDFTKTSGISVF